MIRLDGASLGVASPGLPCGTPPGSLNGWLSQAVCGLSTPGIVKRYFPFSMVRFFPALRPAVTPGIGQKVFFFIHPLSCNLWSAIYFKPSVTRVPHVLGLAYFTSRLFFSACRSNFRFCVSCKNEVNAEPLSSQRNKKKNFFHCT